MTTILRVATMIHSIYDPDVPTRQVHEAVGMETSWSPEQLCILNDYAWWLDEWARGERPTGPRMVIEAVAGSGKTTVLKEMLEVTRKICPEHRLMASAFNRHIAKELMKELKKAKKKGLNAEILGSSNTVNAGGYMLLKEESERRGVSMRMEGSRPKYRALCRQVWAEWLGDLGKKLEYEGGRDWHLINVIAEELDMPLSPRKVWYRVARDLESVVSMLQDCGFNPTDNEGEDREAILELVRKNAKSRNLEGSSFYAFPYTMNPVDMVREVLIRGRDMAFEREICLEDPDDAVVPRPTWDKPDNNFINSGRYDTGLFPLRRWGHKSDEIAHHTQLNWRPESHVHKYATMSFSDQIWLPSVLNLKLNRYQIAFIDEIQDLSVTKGNLYRSLLVDDGTETVVLVGDTRQGIMGWAGADRRAVVKNAEASNCIPYPMTYSWRGSSEVVRSANYAMLEATDQARKLWPTHPFPRFSDHQSPDLESWPVGIEQETIDPRDLVAKIQAIRAENPDATQAIVSRLNGSIGPIAKMLVKKGIPITTPDSSEMLKSIKWVLTAYKSNEYAWQTLAKQRLDEAIKRAGGDKKAAEMDDLYVKAMDEIDLARSLIQMYPKQGISNFKIPEFNKWVKNDLFRDSGNPVHLTSVHRYKGAEADYVYVLRSISHEDAVKEIFLLDHLMHKSPQTAQEELCILYVALTRARIQNIIVKVAR